jgi:RNA polymerase sigma factor (sigma-70 family)
VEELFARLEVPLVGYVRRRLGDLEESRDVVQEAFLKLCQQAWPDIEPHAMAWLYRTCRNRAIDISRREGRMNVIHTNSDVGQLRDARGQQPDEMLEQNEQLSHLRACVGQLSDQQQEVLRLRLHDGLTYRQIAEVTGLTITNVSIDYRLAVPPMAVKASS